MAPRLILQARRESDPETAWVQLQPGARDFSVPEEERIYLHVEGPAAVGLSVSDFISSTGELTRPQPHTTHFEWNPFASTGDVAYGFVTLRVRIPPTREGEPDEILEFYVQILPKRLQLEDWVDLFGEVCRVADALVTHWLDWSNPKVGGIPLHRQTRFSPATAFAEMEPEWASFEASVNRIARRPRTDFRPYPPGMPGVGSPDESPEPHCDADIYENALVHLTAQRLQRILQAIGQRARRTLQDALAHLKFMATAGLEAQKHAEKAVKNYQQLVAEVDRRTSTLRSLIRRLPKVSGVSALHGRVPHLTPRVRLHPDYNRVLRWFRSFGHQRLVFSQAEFFSTLSTRRASSIYEYWSFFALCSALIQLGYEPRFGSFEELIREDLVELEIWRDRPILFTSKKDGETVTLTYEPKACPLADYRKKKTWRKFWGNPDPLPPPGLYAREGPRTPDFLIELEVEGRYAVAVADAIFSEGVEPLMRTQATEDVATRKADKVAAYTSDMMLVREGKHNRMFSRGLVVFCGYPEDVDCLERSTSKDVEFLPLRPYRRRDADEPPFVSLDPRTIDVFREYLDDLRYS